MSTPDMDDAMSERGPGLGGFLLGVGIGVAVGLLFAPDSGDITRRRLARQARRLKEAALDRTEDLRELASGDEPEHQAQPSARAELEEKLAETRRRRRERRIGSQAGSGTVAQEDEPVA